MDFKYETLLYEYLCEGFLGTRFLRTFTFMLLLRICLLLIMNSDTGNF